VLALTAVRVAEALGTRSPRARSSRRASPPGVPSPTRTARSGGCALQALHIDFDLVVAAQQVRSCKPGSTHFTTARERLGSTHWLHTAQSDFHDVAPAHALGIDGARINGHSDKPLPDGVPKIRAPRSDRARRRVDPLSSCGRFTSKCAIIPPA
jgi:hypothetical protein